jgi:predicted Zn-dependent peptidase
LEPAFEEEEISKSIDNHCRKLELNNSKNEIIAYRQLTEKLFGVDAVYGYNSSKESYRNVNKTLLFDYHKNMIEEQECYLFLCGQYDEKVEKAINDSLGQWDYKGTGLIDYKKTITKKNQHYRFSSEQEHQSSIRIGRAFGNRKDEAYAQMSFLNNVLGGFFGSRLMKNLRENKGLTYNIFSSLDTMLFEGYYYINTDISPKYLDETIKEIYYEMNELRRHDISKEELEMNRNYLLGNLLSAVDGPFQSIRIVKSAILNGETEEDLKNTIDVFMKIDAKELKRTAEKFLDPADFIEVIIG